MYTGEYVAVAYNTSGEWCYDSLEPELSRIGLDYDVLRVRATLSDGEIKETINEILRRHDETNTCKCYCLRS